MDRTRLSFLPRFSRRLFLAVARLLPLGPLLGCRAPEARTGGSGRGTRPAAALTLERLPLRLRHTWTIARDSSTTRENALLVLSAEGVTGFGEAAPLTRYGQSYESVAAAFDRVRAAVAGRDPWAHREWLEAAERVAGTDLALVSALDMALWDWKGKRAGAPVHRLLGTPTDRMPVTSFSIGIDSADVMRRKTIEAADYPVLKVKVGLPADRENLAAVRSATARPIRVDANEGWTSPGQARQMIEWLSTLGVELIEQPLPARENEAMGELVGCASAPLVADESAERAADLPALVGRFHGINVKLAKCGGITRALEMIAVGRALGLKIMLGCMIESSLGIAAALALAPLVDWLDLDGNLLLAHDPFCGLSLSDGRWALPDRPGLGVERRS